MLRHTLELRRNLAELCRTLSEIHHNITELRRNLAELRRNLVSDTAPKLSPRRTLTDIQYMPHRDWVTLLPAELRQILLSYSAS